MEGDERANLADSEESQETGSLDVETAEWLRLIAAVPFGVRAAVSTTVFRYSAELSARFYKTLLDEPEAAAFLNHFLVESRLKQSMQHWLTSLFANDGSQSISASIAHQRLVGNSHARIKLPINLVGRGARYLKHWIYEYLADEPQLGRFELGQAIAYVNDLIDLAFETMNASFVSNADRDARTDEAYRLYSLGQNLGTERERQRAALMEWNSLVISTALRRPGTRPIPIGQSEFGLWLVHKALFMFDRSPEVKQIQSVLEKIDAQVVPRLEQMQTTDQLAQIIAQLDTDVSEIKFLLNTLFDRFLEIENGRDALTKLLNRRFLPSTMAREIELAKKSHHPFTVMLLDIDHFKQVNDVYGHDAGDTVLQQIAALIMNNVRAGDFVFRYGGEEMLVILVAVERAGALGVAEKIRRKIEQTSIVLSGGRSLQITVSAGLASYDGHPDYRRVITRADTAVYEAKSTGRNRCVFAD
jgi:diguanylate cyclase